jgi:hypothetical protein
MRNLTIEPWPTLPPRSCQVRQTNYRRNNGNVSDAYRKRIRPRTGGWTARLVLPPGNHALKVRATNCAGQSQPLEPLLNPGGYMRNVAETTNVTAA